MPRLTQLCKADQLKRAHCWGLAMRLGQRLSRRRGFGARTDQPRARQRVRSSLCVRRGEEALVGDAVERRLAAACAKRSVASRRSRRSSSGVAFRLPRG